MQINYFGIQFPESMFPPQNILEYSAILNAGYTYLYTTRPKILVCGLARDCVKELHNNVERFKALNLDITFDIVENDSIDETREYILNNQLGQSYNIGTPKMTGKGLLRRTAMADMRNKYIPEIPYDYTIVYDFDIKGGFSYEGLFHSFGLLHIYKDIGAITANGLLYSKLEDGSKSKVYYDSWTYRPLEECGENYNLLDLKRGDKPYEVKAAFGGMSIYRGLLFTKNFIKYSNEDCEHISICNQIRFMGYKIIVNPSLIVLYNGHYYVQ